jgi:hypothetical protein
VDVAALLALNVDAVSQRSPARQMLSTQQTTGQTAGD